MRVHQTNGKDYRLPDYLNAFQQKMYEHLINWKRDTLKITEAGYYKQLQYDAILPEIYSQQEKMPHIYEPILDYLHKHRKKNPFRIHPHFYHVVSSQAANINLFLPILHSTHTDEILRKVKCDFKSLAKDQLDHGYCIEFWGGNYDTNNSKTGLLGDKNETAGTDADIAIAYRNHQDELCLWLIEHKLTEKEFTDCGGYASKGRTDKKKHDCNCTFDQILTDKNTCYYHNKCNYKYWEITEANRDIFINTSKYKGCPFKGGLNQLWRNLLLALAIEKDESNPFKHVTFSVVKHPENSSLEPSIKSFKDLIGDNPKFTVHNSGEFIQCAEDLGDENLIAWAKWYRNVYMI